MDACSHVAPPKHYPFNKTGGLGNKWIALIKRGNCDFDLKVLNAQYAGFIAVVVYNNESGSAIGPMNGGHCKSISISNACN